MELCTKDIDKGNLPNEPVMEYEHAEPWYGYGVTP
jgi:hypothetical protein